MEEENKDIVKKETPSVDADASGVDDPTTDADNPLWMPMGSVRSIIALTVICGFMIFVFKYPVIPQELNNLLMIVVGFYFGSKNK